MVLYGFYALSCLHWIGLEQVAVVWNRKFEWSEKIVGPNSYTLLKRMPLLRNPLSTRPGIAILPIMELGKAKLVRAKLRGISYRTRSLAVVAGISGIYLLLFLPVFIYLGLLPLLWKPLSVIMLSLHSLVVIEFIACTRMWRRRDSATFISALISVCLNPVAAIRSADVVCGWKLSVIL